MAIPKKQLQLIVELMEALPPGDYLSPPAIQILPNDELYVGYMDERALERLEAMGIVRLVCTHDDGDHVVKLVEREDFLSSFEAGVSEARNGSDMHYADYSNHQFAFSCGYEHYINRTKSKRKFPDYSFQEGYVCHGFDLADTGERWKQV